MDCIFCAIVRGEVAASIAHDDDLCLAFMGIRPVRPGALMVIPKQHIDHFIDLPDALAAHIFTVGQQVARRVAAIFKPLRMGYVVHGFGVAHAHLHVIPQHHIDDITSARMLTIVDGEPRFSLDPLDEPSRAVLDEQAALLRIA